jgi:hypothetical protein
MKLITISKICAALAAALAVQCTTYALSILSQPQSAAVPVGGTTTFSVAAESTNSITYQWYRGASPIGSNSPSFTVTNAQASDFDEYHVALDDGEETATSDSAYLSIITPGMYNGLFQGESGFTHETAGFISTKVTASNKYSAKIVLEGDALSASGPLGQDGRATNIVSRAKFSKPPVTLIVAMKDGATMGGSISGTNWISEINAQLVLFSKTNLYPAFGTFTAEVPGCTSYPRPNGGDFPPPMLLPEGYGYQLIRISTNGVIKMSGRAADGALWKQSTPMVGLGTWPLYAAMYLRKEILPVPATGSAIGWVNVYGNIGGSILVTKKAFPSDVYYPLGFTNYTYVSGGVFTPPQLGQRIMDFTFGGIQLTYGDLSNEVASLILLSDDNKVFVADTAQKIKLGFNKKSGLMTGSFIHPSKPLKPTKFYGVVLQNPGVETSPEKGIFNFSYDYASGFFLGVTNGGDVYVGGLGFPY